MQAQQFDWLSELNQTITHSLVTTFGLDLVLFKDKVGGNVDTIHNVRQGVWATQTERLAYENRDNYDSYAYHRDQSFIEKGRQDKALKKSGKLFDVYRQKIMSPQEKHHVDHIVSAKEIHDDPGRLLAESDGVKLANRSKNLQSTLDKINLRKNKNPVNVFLNDSLPNSVENLNKKICQTKTQLANLPKNASNKEVLELKRKLQHYQKEVGTLSSIDQKAMRKKDFEARNDINDQINQAYYGSSKFLRNTAEDALSQGIRMTERQMIGMVLAEIWFEFTEFLPRIVDRCKKNFKFSKFWEETKKAFLNVIERVKKRFKEFISKFKDNMLSGIFSSLSTTIINIFATTSKQLGKLLRESWTGIVQVIKLITFNPNKLSRGELTREVIRILMATVSTILGVMLYQHLITLLSAVPYGDLIASFLSAFATGLLVLGTTYFIDHSSIMKKVWKYLDSLKSKYDNFLEHIKEINAELDRYVTELARIEFNLNTAELHALASALKASSNEYEKNIILKQETTRRNIKLPFEMGDKSSTIAWLKTKTKK